MIVALLHLTQGIWYLSCIPNTSTHLVVPGNKDKASILKVIGNWSGHYTVPVFTKLPIVR